MDASTPATTQPSAAHDDLSFWQVVRLSLKGQHFDYTSLPLNRAVLLLAVPMVLEMIMESLFAVVDVFWVSRLGSDAIAVVGLTESVMTLIYAVAIGISFAATAIVARRIGEQDPERAAQAAGQIIVIGVTVAAGMGLVLSYFAPDILRLLGASASVIAQGTDFNVGDVNNSVGSLFVEDGGTVTFNQLGVGKFGNALERLLPFGRGTDEPAQFLDEPAHVCRVAGRQEGFSHRRRVRIRRWRGWAIGGSSMSDITRDSRTPLRRRRGAR